MNKVIVMVIFCFQPPTNTITYKIIDGTGQGFLFVNPTNGDITLLKSVDGLVSFRNFYVSLFCSFTDKCYLRFIDVYKYVLFTFY